MSNSENCAICFNPKTNETYMSDCSHSFCATCIECWREEHIDCPLCRKVSFPETCFETRKRVLKKENDKDIKKFLMLYVNKKLLVTRRDFVFYQDIFQVFLKYPHIFFSDLLFRKLILYKINQEMNEKMLEWSRKEKRKINQLMDSIKNLIHVFNEEK